MAECSYARCVQERRAIKKELQRWTKNMVFVVGLERVAEELMGRRKWRQYQDVVLKSPLAAEVEPEVSDWEPRDKCCFCDGSSFLGPAPSPASDSGSSTNSRSSFRETPPVSSDGHSAAHLSSSAAMTTLESVTSMAASLAAVAALSVNSNASSAATGASANPSATAMSMFPPSTPHSGLLSSWYMSPPPPHLPPGLRIDTVTPAPKQESPIPAMVMSLPASTASEQPLDLSAKATLSATPTTDNSLRLGIRSPTPDPSLKVPSVIDKHIYKAKPRSSAVAGRRQYTEEELQAALRDIQSGKLGTRRAAVIYGIPRSTLRNKVYKLAMERERDSHLPSLSLVDKALLVPPVVAIKEEDIKEEELDDKELSGAEDEREVEKALRKPLLSMEDLVRFSMLEGGGLMAADAFRALLQHGKFLEEKQRGVTAEREEGAPSPSLPLYPTTADFWQSLEHSALGPLISQILATSGGQNRDISPGIGNKNPEGGLSSNQRESSPTNVVSDYLPKFPAPLLPELVRRMMAEEEQMRKSKLAAHQADVNFLVNGAHMDEAEKGKAGKLVGLPSPSVITRSDVSKADAEESPDADASATGGPSGTATPPNVILKIPSFKPTSKNGVASSGTPSGIPAETLPFTHGTFPHPSITPESSQHLSMSVQLGSGGTRSNHSDSCSPPIPNLSGKGIGVSLRDVIAKSISQKFHQPGADVSHFPLSQKLLLPGDGSDQPAFKRSRFTPPVGCNTPSMAAPVIKHNNNNTHSDDKNAAHKMSTSSPKPATSGNSTGSSGSGGKGTRPKRGKYRNYDRDSLVEAVRAVQRGEMSVHRAGSYYGVPHSTLEYKVKERHLMRPRKREQKSQLDSSKPKEEDNTVKATPSVTMTAVAATPSLPASADKLQTPPKPPKAPFTPTSPLPAAPNGLKIPPLFDPSISPLAYATPPPFPFWPHPPFHPSLPLPDYVRSGGAGGSFNPGSEQFFASQMIQRLQEESSRVHGSSSPGISSAVHSPPIANASATLGKSAREMAESLYDGTGANGSFLDGIIRSSLEMGIPPGAHKDGINKATSEKLTAPENLSNKALLDQLCRNSRLAPLPRPSTQSHASSDEETAKHPSESSSSKSSGDGCPVAVVDLSATNSQTEPEPKTISAEEEEGVESPKSNNTKEISSDDETNQLSKEVNGLSNATDDSKDNVSACDSMSNLKRVSDIDAAKDLKQEGGSENLETQEDTKSNKINS